MKEGWQVVEGVLRLRLVADIAPVSAWALCSLRPVPIRTTRPGRGAVAHFAGLDSLRQLPGDAVRRGAPGGDGPGRTVALASIRGTVQRRVKEG